MKIGSNYSFCVEWVLRQQQGVRALDYGCGAGEIVLALRERGVECYGCDVYYEGGDRSLQVDPALAGNGIVRRMDAGSIPFEDGHFDLVISNQVLEHVENLDATLAEISRVVKPGGKVLSLFPHQEAWFEWHVGIPFIHWFVRGSRLRDWYALAMRTMGWGFFKAGKTRSRWSRDAVAWVDNWTHYRTRRDIERAFASHFADSCRLEGPWLDHKLGGAFAMRILPSWLKQRVTILLAGLVFECEKPVRAGRRADITARTEVA